MDITTYQLKITLITPLLGSQPTRDIATEFLAARAGFEELPEDEIETLPDALERGTTVFHKLSDGTPVLYDYHISGFLREAGRVLNRKVTGKVANLRSKVENLVFVSPRQIRIRLPDAEDIDYLERPLRAQTAQGPRVALARSEMVPEGASISCGLSIFPGEISEAVLRDLLDYGFYRGLGQWRNGGWGRFRYELEAEE